MRIEMLHQYEGHTSIGRHIGEERFESGEPTSRGANADDKAVRQEIVREGLGGHERLHPSASEIRRRHCESWPADLAHWAGERLPAKQHE